MVHLDLRTRKHCIVLKQVGLSFGEIRQRIKEEDEKKINVRTLQHLWKKFVLKQTILDLPRKPRPAKLTDEMVKAIDEMLAENDELDSRMLRNIFTTKYSSLKCGITTIKRAQRNKGWVCTRPHYCQLLCEANKAKQLAWCKEQIINKEDFKM